jgi:hypothetical protein
MADIDCYAPTVAAHWQRACLNEKGFAGREVPFNQSLALGLLALELFRYDSDNVSLAALLVGLTNDFLINSNIHVGPDGGAHWLYWSAPQSGRLLTPAARATHRRFEDTAHGNIVVSYLMLFAHQQNRILQTAGAANPLVHRITPEFLATLSHSVHIERSEGKILVDRTMGERPRQDTTSAANARLLQQWCLLSSALRDTCQLAARQTKDPVVISYAALAQTHGH